MLKQWLAQLVYRPLYYRVYGSFRHGPYWKFLNDSQWHSLEDNRKVQEDLLYKMLEHCIRNIPYYRHVAKERNIRLSRDTVKEDLADFPILTKDIIRKENKDLIADQGLHSYRYSSGGSTGEPIILTQDFEYKMKMLLHKELQLGWAGIKPWDRTVQLWGSPVDIFCKREGLRHRIANWINSTTVLNALTMDEDHMAEYVRELNRIRPRFILSYAQSLTDLARYVMKHGLTVHRPHAIMVSASKLYPEARALIETVFERKVFDRYGTREVGDIGSECTEHKGLHMSMFMHYAEILGHDLKPVKAGVPGELYITLLTNFTMPLVRYRIGDTVIAGEDNCPCGRGLPILKDVVGRECDNFYREDGSMVPGGWINYVLGFRETETCIKQYQVLQHSPKSIEIRVIVDEMRRLKEEKGPLEGHIRAALGKGCKIKWTAVKKIRPTSSGKYRHTVRLFDKRV